jgi:hypothetical protein
MYRELFSLEKQLPSIHLDSLRKYLQTSSGLIPGEEELNRPVIRHPDLQPSNIFVSDDFEITSLIDWQHTVVLPLLLQSDIPDLDGSVELAPYAPESPSLPDNLSTWDEDSRQEQLEISHKRKSHHFYMTETSRHSLMHYEALTLSFSVGRRKIYDLSCSPWQGDNVPLRSSLMFLARQWAQITARPDVPCSISFTLEE